MSALAGQYACQFVFVVKLAAVLNTVWSITPGSPSGLKGSEPWRRWSAWSRSMPATLNRNTLTAYPVQRCSRVSSTPQTA